MEHYKKPAILQVQIMTSFPRSRDLGHNLNLIFGENTENSLKNSKKPAAFMYHFLYHLDIVK